jgi:5-formyltetrahydrofolate cyclo-ligase
MNKEYLRALFRKKRVDFYQKNPKSYKDFSQKICHMAFKQICPTDTCVGLFSTMSGEVETDSLIFQLNVHQVPIALPQILPENHLCFRRWSLGDGTTRNSFGISEPFSTAPQCSPSLIFLPLLAYGTQGERLGLGKGFYDRYFHSLTQQPNPLKLGLAFSWAYSPELKADDHDVPLDGIITENGLQWFYREGYT